ncbi:MAG: hypothetical protein ACKOXK_05960 [Chakrabartia sp.]
MENQNSSGLGIASFVISLVSGIALFLLIIMAGILELSTPGGVDEESGGAMILGLFLLLFMGASCVSLVLGIIALSKKQGSNVFPLLGTVFSGIALVGTIGIMILGSI